MMNNIVLKGKSSSSVSKDTRSRTEQADPIPTICMLTDKYGLTEGSEYIVMPETPSGPSGQDLGQNSLKSLAGLPRWSGLPMAIW